MTSLPLQPTLKAPSTAKSSQLLAVARHTPNVSRSTSQVRQQRGARHDGPSSDFLSEKATSSLIRRVLIPESHGGSDSRVGDQPIEELLPPLTSSNDVDIQLYALIAIVVKDFVHTWYSKITPDHAFVDEVVQIIAHCSRAVEQRLRQADMVELFLNDLPRVLERHIAAQRTANEAHLILSYGKKPRHIYHSLNPHPALDPDLPSDQQKEAERAYRQLLVQGALAVLLPTEDLQNSCLRVLVTDIIADLILGRAIDERSCHGWFLHGSISKVAATISVRTKPKVTGAEIHTEARSRLEQFGLLSYKSEVKQDNSPRRRQSSLAALFWMVLQWVYLAIITARFVVMEMLHARRLAGRMRRSMKFTSLEATSTFGSDFRSLPVLDYGLFPAISTLLDLSKRMPWLASALSFWQHFLTSGTGHLAGPDSTVDKFLYFTASQNILTSSLLPQALKNLRSAIFPNNTLGAPAPPAPSQEERLKIRRNAASDGLSLIPSIVPRTLFATKDEKEVIRVLEEDILSLFEDSHINKYWIYGMLEAIILAVVPEMQEKTVSELFEERGVSLNSGIEQEMMET